MASHILLVMEHFYILYFKIKVCNHFKFTPVISKPPYSHARFHKYKTNLQIHCNVLFQAFFYSECEQPETRPARSRVCRSAGAEVSAHRRRLQARWQRREGGAAHRPPASIRPRLCHVEKPDRGRRVRGFSPRGCWQTWSWRKNLRSRRRNRGTTSKTLSMVQFPFSLCLCSVQMKHHIDPLLVIK